MNTEIEAKFTNIDAGILRHKLRDLHAVLKQEERLMIRANYDFPDSGIAKMAGWVRVRDEGDKITLSYKQLNDRTIHGTKEVNLVISSFSHACIFLESIGLKQKSYQETKRESWILDGVEVELDTWPWIPSFVELEGKSEIDIKKVAHKLGLNWQKALHGSVETAYQEFYDVTEEEIDNWQTITFTEIPEWLKSKKK